MSDNRYRILLADFDYESLAHHSVMFSKAGYCTLKTSNSDEVKNHLIIFRPHILLIDMVNKEESCRKVCEFVRRSSILKNTIILIYTSNIEQVMTNRLLNMLTDDILKKTMEESDLLNRIRFFLKNIRQEPESRVLEFGGLMIDVDGYVVRKESKVIEMAKKEFELLLLLVSEPRKLFSRMEINEQIWGNSIGQNERILDVYIAKLRHKIGKNHISTKKGVGYSFTY